MTDIADLQRLEVVEQARDICCEASHPVTYYESIHMTVK
jgi:hypothetical protein